MTLRVNATIIDDDAIRAEAARVPDAFDPEAAARRALAVRELLLQRAGEAGLLEEGRPRAGTTFASREAEDAVIGRLLDAEVHAPHATPEECRRHYEAHAGRYRTGDLVEARHILFAVTPRTPVTLLRAKAEATLAELRAEPSRFGEQAQALSNCPSAALGGSLGQFSRGQMVPEVDAAVFASETTGILPQLVTSRYGFHIVSIDHRIAGRTLPFEQARAAIASELEARVTAQALRQYVALLAGQAQLEGVDLAAAASPLLQ